MIILITRIIKYAFQNFWRNSLISSASIAVLILSLLLVSNLILFGAAGQTAIQVLKNKIDISIYFKADISENQILAIKKNLENLEEVKSVEYISAEEALARFKEIHQNDPIILQSLEELGYNPLTASLNIKAKDPRNYQAIAAYLENEVPNVLVDKINYYQNQILIERLNKIINTLRGGGIILFVFLALVTCLVVFNTIRLAIYSNRESIEIMRLVGASNSLIRGPYIVEGVILALVASIITLLILIPLIQLANPYFQVLIPEFSLKNYFWQNFFAIFGIQTFVGILLGVFSSLIAIRKYLRI